MSDHAGNQVLRFFDDGQFNMQFVQPGSGGLSKPWGVAQVEQLLHSALLSAKLYRAQQGTSLWRVQARIGVWVTARSFPFTADWCCLAGQRFAVRAVLWPVCADVVLCTW